LAALGITRVDGLRATAEILCGCIAGAAPVERIETWLAQAGFIDVRATPPRTAAN
jgi:hypothetical protein